jgi:hypothetical protein
MPEHEMQLDYENGRFIATCTCGNWREESPVGTTRSTRKPSDVLLAIEESFAKHVEQSKK